MNFVPAVNIVISWDPQAVIAFQETKSFAALKEQIKDNKLVSIFDNAPNSQVLSLEHSFSPKQAGSAKSATITIQFVDPQGLFEEAMIDLHPRSGYGIAGTPLMDELKKRRRIARGTRHEHSTLLTKRNDINEAQKNSEWDRRTNKDRLNEAQKNLKNYESGILKEVEDQLKELEDLTPAQFAGKEKYLIDQALLKLTPLLGRPVYITYGIGDKLEDWAPIQCYGTAVGAEYDYNGEEPRKLTISWAGNGLHPNLTQIGISDLGAHGLHYVTVGVSERVFDEDTLKRQEETFRWILKQNEAVELETTLDLKYRRLSNQHDVFGLSYTFNKAKLYSPSVHVAVTEAIRSFISRGINTRNVLVLLPDLDFYLQKYIETKKKSVKGNFEDGMLNIPGLSNEQRIDAATFREVVQGLGFQLATVPTDESEYKNKAIGAVFSQYKEEVKRPEDFNKWLNSHEFRVSLEADNLLTPVLTKLDQVGEAINAAIQGKSREIQVDTRVETDYQMLKLMEDAGLIEDSTTPAVIWGDKIVIHDYLYANLLENDAAVDKERLYERWNGDMKKAIRENVTLSSVKELNPTTRTVLTENYMKNVLDYVYPSTWTGPFGPTTLEGASDRGLVTYHDSEVSIGNKLAGQTRAYDARKTRQLPVFTFGTVNPNVIQVNIDINNQFAKFVTMGAPEIAADQCLNSAIVAANFENEAAQMFTSLRKLDMNKVDKETGIPIGFKALVDPFLYSRGWSIFGITYGVKDFGGWDKIFQSLPDYQGGKGTSLDAGWDEKNDYYLFMWEAFQMLLKQEPKTAIIQRSAGEDADVEAIKGTTTTAAKMTEMAMNGSITTLPMFALSTTRRANNRPCLLYCVEPKMLHYEKEIEQKKNATWFSGFYDIMGFTHKISGDSVQSEFEIVKSPRSGISFGYK